MRQLAWNDWKTRMLAAAVVAVLGARAPAQSLPSAASTAPARLVEVAAEASDRAYLGIYIEGEADGGGVKLAEIVADSPAAKAGLQAGDVIVALNGVTIADEMALRDAIAKTGVGKKVKVTFLRDGQKRNTSAKLAAAPEESGVSEEGAGEVVEVEAGSIVDLAAPPARGGGMAGVGGTGAPASDSGWLGVTLAENDGKVTIEQVIDGSPAAAAGLQAGDVIVTFDGEEIGGVEALVEAVTGHKPGATVRMQVDRGGERRRIRAKLGTRDAAALAGAGVVGGVAVTESTPPPKAPRVAVPAAPAAPTPPPAPARAARVRAAGRAPAVAAPQVAAPAADAKQDAALAEMKQQIDALRKELDALRDRCERQQRQLEKVRKVLDGEPESEAQSMAAPTPGETPAQFTFLNAGSAGEGSDGGVTFTVVGADGKTAQDGRFELALATAPQADGTLRIEGADASGLLRLEGVVVGGDGSEQKGATILFAGEKADGGDSCCTETTVETAADDGGDACCTEAPATMSLSTGSSVTTFGSDDGEYEFVIVGDGEGDDAPHVIEYKPAVAQKRVAGHPIVVTKTGQDGRFEVRARVVKLEEEECAATGACAGACGSACEAACDAARQQACPHAALPAQKHTPLRVARTPRHPPMAVRGAHGPLRIELEKQLAPQIRAKVRAKVKQAVGEALHARRAMPQETGTKGDWVEAATCGMHDGGCCACCPHGGGGSGVHGMRMHAPAQKGGEFRILNLAPTHHNLRIGQVDAQECEEACATLELGGDEQCEAVFEFVDEESCCDEAAGAQCEDEDEDECEDQCEDEDDDGPRPEVNV